MASALRVLFIEDSEDDCRLLLRELRQRWEPIVHHRVDKSDALTIALATGTWDIVISDFAMPRFSGLAALAQVRRSANDLPFILVSGVVGEETAVEAIKAGANDYLFKGSLTRLGPAVERELRDAAIRREARRMQAQLADAQRLARVGTWHRNFINDTAIWSEETFRIFGLKPMEDREPGNAPKFAEVLNAIHPEDRSNMTGPLQDPNVQSWANDFRVVLPSGEVRYVYMRGDIVRDVGGKAVEAAGSTQDITERKLAEEELRRAMKDLGAAKNAAEAANRAKDRFLAVLSHELRTPLTPVLAMVSSLLGRSDLQAEFREELEAIRRNVETEARLIDDLLDLTRIARSQVELECEEVDVHAAIHQAIGTISSDIAAKRLNVSLQLAAEKTRIWADPRRLQQILLNLLSNATRFTPEGGRIMIQTADQGAQTGIEITDTGIGIEPDLLARLFNAFEQGEQTEPRRYGGLGLGLAIARALVELHQGTLTASSPGKNQGATFTLRLPLATAKVAARPAPVSATTGATSPKRRILLVEDHEDTLRVMSKLLRSYGHEVKTATGVGAAIELLDRERFDILLSDIGLPDGSGLEIMRHAKKAQLNLKGIALSGLGMEDDLRRSREVGFEQHLTKPISVEKLMAAVERMATR